MYRSGYRRIQSFSLRCFPEARRLPGVSCMGRRRVGQLKRAQRYQHETVSHHRVLTLRDFRILCRHAVKTFDHPSLMGHLAIEKVPLVPCVWPEVVCFAQIIREDDICGYSIVIIDCTVVAYRQWCVVDRPSQGLPDTVVFSTIQGDSMEQLLHYLNSSVFVLLIPFRMEILQTSHCGCCCLI